VYLSLHVYFSISIFKKALVTVVARAFLFETVLGVTLIGLGYETLGISKLFIFSLP